ncbi:hypothetical protein T458_24465 [Brevibacillus panacihumi W25]|uniref:Uracil-DNA glycosylase-like domain-containing protein n=1 Tax=Brevibacillus panacihumi W25 TaxID=1408254 RepID=V6M0N3_9BACL|nr:hypothetical protein [Brevibacillus panacihumi]EST52174.1 hypothetical protein T458_24465 [Brevibacillus panacihumi W25]
MVDITKKFFLEDIYISQKEPYLRPFLCKTYPKEIGIFIVGINPATPIYPSDLAYKDYISLLCDYNNFKKFYINKRLNQGKKGISRTRIGIDNLTSWIEYISKKQVIETNVTTYPTSSSRELKKINTEIISISQDLFIKTLKIFKPNILIIHGKEAFNSLLNLLLKKKISYYLMNKAEDINVIENLGPVAYIYLENHLIYVFAIRHLMYFGRTGNTFNGFKSIFYNFLQGSEHRCL